MVDRNKVEMSRVPILVILGATGSGKSRLAIELARRFTGEIISADSMQVYKSLDIITAKVTPAERQMAPHHMLDVVDPLNNFSVIDFRDMSLPIIDKLLARRKLPIVVGGTNYYIESLLWEILIDYPKDPPVQADSSAPIENRRSDGRYNVRDIRQNDDDDSDDDDGAAPVKKLKFDARLCDESNEVLHRRLMEVDPAMARKLHPNNRRKVIRSLEVFHQFGKTHSELLEAQRAAGGCGLGGPLRYPNTIILWLRCNNKVLGKRLDNRVDGMLEAGLVQELLDFHRRYNEHRIKTNTSPDYTKGIFQSIGFKEFHAYLTLPEEERASEKVPPVYSLDCTDVTKWDCCVLEPAAAIVSAILRGEKPEQRPLNENIENQKITDSSTNIYNYCEVCNRIFIEEDQWQAHLKGAKHMRMLKKKKKEAENTQKSKKMTNL
ncbi:tRNA dimethylallyltransferase isoform X1 [Linepithema humile]|uniref:tRNA dimethylallyltransferase isoform X1 n=1 Tax=Linepithema humile TaxID=83485 RepID=UPI00062324EA|nr:PREDICTED: tRNA dimethylallyltransferase, mitochondrial isoform X2 [Linepithema humile]